MSQDFLFRDLLGNYNKVAGAGAKLGSHIAHVRVCVRADFGKFAHMRAMRVRPGVMVCEYACVRPKKLS